MTAPLPINNPFNTYYFFRAIHKVMYETRYGFRYSTVFLTTERPFYDLPVIVMYTFSIFL